MKKFFSRKLFVATLAGVGINAGDIDTIEALCATALALMYLMVQGIIDAKQSISSSVEQMGSKKSKGSEE